MFRELDELLTQLQSFGGMPRIPLRMPAYLFNSEPLFPSMNLVDEVVDEKEVRYVAEMAGMDKDKINVSVEDGILTIDAENDTKKYHESITLRHKVEGEPKATYRNGILEVTFQRRKPKSIKVDIL